MNRPSSQPSGFSPRPAKVLVLDTSAAVAQAVASHILSKVKKSPASVLGLATGETPKPVYAALVAAYRAGEADFSRTTTFNLDEYAGLADSHPDSFAAYMERELFGATNFQPARVHLLKGDAADMGEEAVAYETAIAASGGIDVQLLGIGSNGHIGFNEPGAPSSSRTRLVELSPSTLEANLSSMTALGAVPRQAITMGMATILDAREIILMATGARKAEAVAKAILQDPDISCPASLLSLHPNVYWYLDHDAASLLDNART